MANYAKKSVGFNGLSDTSTLPIYQAVRLLMCCGDDNLLNDEFYPDGEIKDIPLEVLISVLRDQYDKVYLDAQDRVIEFEESHPVIDSLEYKKEYDALKEKENECNELIGQCFHNIMSYEHMLLKDIADITSGNPNQSKLVLDIEASKKLDEDRITIASLYQWAESHNIKIGHGINPSESIVDDSRHGSLALRNIEITTYFLAQALADLVKKAKLVDKAKGTDILDHFRGDEAENPLIAKDGSFKSEGVTRYLIKYIDGIANEAMTEKEKKKFKSGQGGRAIKNRLRASIDRIKQEEMISALDRGREAYQEWK